MRIEILSSLFQLISYPLGVQNFKYTTSTTTHYYLFKLLPPPLLRDMLGGWGICICIVFDDENGQFILIIFWIRWTVKRQPRWSSSINNQQITSVLSRELHAVTLRKIFIHRGVIIIVVSYKYSRIVSIVACSDLQWF